MQALWSPDDSITRSAARHGGASLGVSVTGFWSYFDLIFPCFAQFCPCCNGNIYSATVCWTHMTGFFMLWSFQLRDDLSLERNSELKVWKSIVKYCGKFWSWIGCASNHEMALSLWGQGWKDMALKWNAWVFSREGIDLWLIVRGKTHPKCGQHHPIGWSFTPSKKDKANCTSAFMALFPGFGCNDCFIFHVPYNPCHNFRVKINLSLLKWHSVVHFNQKMRKVTNTEG